MPERESEQATRTGDRRQHCRAGHEWPGPPECLRFV